MAKPEVGLHVQVDSVNWQHHKSHGNRQRCNIISQLTKKWLGIIVPKLLLFIPLFLSFCLAPFQYVCWAGFTPDSPVITLPLVPSRMRHNPIDIVK